MPRTSVNAPPAWRTVAASLAEQIPSARLHANVAAWLKLNASVREPWAVAVSGGADSVALLLLLWAHFPRHRRRLVVFHYDHATRAGSAADAAFVKALAKALELPCELERRDAAASAPATEAVLREARWDFFRTKLRERQARLVFFGHQREDVAETLLMRLASGSGGGGLSSPRPVRPFADGVIALRPLLDLGRDELRAALRAAGGAWREDPSNDSDIYLRNRIRRRVLPVLREVFGERDFVAGAARSRALLEEDDEALEAIAHAALGGFAEGEPFRMTKLSNQSRALWRRALRSWLQAHSLNNTLSAAAFDELHRSLMVGEGGRWSAGQGCWLEVRNGTLVLSRTPRKPIARPDAVQQLRPGQPLLLPDGGSLVSAQITNALQIADSIKSSHFDPCFHACLALGAQLTDSTLLVRPWAAGDRYRPLGAPGSRKLQDLFTDKKIPAGERRRLPVVCNSANQPLWVPGLPPAESCRVQPETPQALWLTYYPPG